MKVYTYQEIFHKDRSMDFIERLLHFQANEVRDIIRTRAQTTVKLINDCEANKGDCELPFTIRENDKSYDEYKLEIVTALNKVYTTYILLGFDLI